MNEDGPEKSIEVVEPRKERKRGLIIGSVVFCVLVLVGVGVIVWDGGDGNSSTTPGGDDGGAVQEERLETLDDIRANVDVSGNKEEVLAYIDGKIAEYMGTEMEFYVRLLIKVQYLLMINELEEALVAAEEINVGGLDDEKLLSYYQQMSEIYYRMDNMEQSNYYNGLYMEVIAGYDNNPVGGKGSE